MFVKDLCLFISDLLTSYDHMITSFYQGILHEVTNKHHYYLTPDTFELFYQQPFSLDNVPMYFVITLSVYNNIVYIVTTNDTCSVISVTAPYLNESYIINILPVNGAGNGMSSNYTILFPNSKWILIV